MNADQDRNEVIKDVGTRSKALGLLGRSGCLLSILALVAIVLYPKAKWLFVVVAVGIALVWAGTRFVKETSRHTLADHAERLLNGNMRTWDVDDYEHLNPRDSRLRELWLETMQLGGPPEEWGRLDEDKKNEMRDIIRSIRNLSSNRE